MGLFSFLARMVGLGSKKAEPAPAGLDFDKDDLEALPEDDRAAYEAELARVKAAAEAKAAEEAEAAERAATQEPSEAPGTRPIPSTVVVDAGDDLDDALSMAFLGGGGGDLEAAPSVRAPEPIQEGGPRELFAGIASNYARPVKNFMCDLKRGEATKQWIDICLPVTNTIIEAAESLDLTTVAERMGDFGAALSIAQGEQGHVLRGESRELLLSCYDELIELLPETFVLEERDEKRESIIIHSLLQQIDGMGSVTFDKLYAAGLTTLDALVLARKEDLAIVAGVPEHLCEQVCAKVQEHHKQLTDDAGDGGQSFLRNQLIAATAELRKQHGIFEAATADPTPSAERDAKKRDSRRERQACALRINVLLAEMGNLDLVEELQKLAFGRRIEKLESYVQTLNDELLAASVMAVDGAVSSDLVPTGR